MGNTSFCGPSVLPCTDTSHHFLLTEGQRGEEVPGGHSLAGWEESCSTGPRSQHLGSRQEGNCTRDSDTWKSRLQERGSEGQPPTPTKASEECLPPGVQRLRPEF